MAETQLAVIDNEAKRLCCMFCDQAPMFREPRARQAARRPALLCLTCARMFGDQRWDELALRWLQHRPEDWTGDVSAFLEMVAKM